MITQARTTPVAPWMGGIGWLGFVAALVAVLLTALVPASANESYELGPQDKVRLKVHEWRATVHEFVEWKALNDDYIVSSDGTLSLPFAGVVPVMGRSLDELSQIIGERLMSEMGLGRQPSISLEVIEYRPFYILGEVKNPGEYPYRPGLTVLQAVSIAGGMRQVEGGNLIHLERETINVAGERERLGQTAEALIAQRARLQAELKGAESVEFPPELMERGDQPAIALLMEQEGRIFEARLDGFRTQTRALEELKTHLQKEVVSLQGQLEAHRSQMELLQKELDSVTSLVERGLTVASRQFSMERNMAQLEGERLRVETSLLRAHQEISRTEIARLQLRHERSNEINRSLREVQDRLEETGSRTETAERLLHHSRVMGPALRNRTEMMAQAEPTFMILRRLGGKTIEISASETTPVEPGDTVKVDLPFTPMPFAAGSSWLSPETGEPSSERESSDGSASAAPQIPQLPTLRAQGIR